MEMRDNTKEWNEEGADGLIFMVHGRSAEDRWAIGIEEVTAGRFNVSVMVKETGWPDHGVVRYWGFDDRQMAEARYLELQRLLAPHPEEVTMKALLATLPAAEYLPRERDED